MGLVDELATELGMDAATLRGQLLAADESLTPNYLTANSDGTVGATFTGHVAASGIDLTAWNSEATPAPSPQLVDWIRQSDGSVVADIFGLYAPASPGNFSEIFIEAGNPDEGWIPGRGTFGGVQQAAQIRATSSPQSGGSAIHATVIDPVNSPGQGIDIIKSDGQSSFLQLLTLAKRKINFGSSALNFPGSAISSRLTIAHGLGVIPVFFVYFSEAPSDNIVDAIAVNYTASPDNVNIYISGRTVSGTAIGPGTTPGRWAAVG